MKLFDFQEEAVQKFLKVRNVLLGDDMGLGKTVTAIELDRRRRRSESFHNKRTGMKTLVVTLKSVMSSWEDHFQEWNPQLKILTIDSKNRTAFTASITSGTYDVYICHWEALRLMPELQRRKWFHVIADETHKIKNRKAQMTQAFKKIPAEYKTAMSGTWADNNPDDGWSTLNYLYPKEWGSYWNFYNHHVIFQEHGVGFCFDCQKTHKNKYRVISGVEDAEGLHQRMDPFYVRRTKEEVLKDLPEKYYTQINVELHPQQRRAYNEMRSNMLAWVGKHQDEPIAAPIVVAQLIRLQQFAVGYAQIVELKNGKTAVQLGEPSSKLDAVMEIIEQSKGQIVVFGQSKQAIMMLEARLKKENITNGILTGDTKQEDRGRLVKEFQDHKLRVFAGTIKAGGVGLTLTAASTLVFLDRTWSPSANKQAEDRLHRIGQKNGVQIIDLVANDTIDAGRLQRLELKWEWIRQILGDAK